MNPRYARQMVLPGVGSEGQEQLRQASVLIVGVGGLGSPLALYLAAAGVGRLVLVDDDRVQESNLHRQILYSSEDTGRLKVEAAAQRLRALNPDVCIEAHATRLTSTNARTFVQMCSIVADGSDNFATRYLVNDACVLESRPCVHASVLHFEGQLTVLHHRGGPCYRCLYPASPPPGIMPSCNDGGVLGPVVGAMGALQATEVLKILLGLGNPLAGRLLTLDALQGVSRTVAFSRQASCSVCGQSPVIHKLEAGQKTSRDDSWNLSISEARALLSSAFPPLLIDVRSAVEHATENIGGRLLPLGELASQIHTLDASRALLVYCASGVRSAQAALRLREAGIEAYSLRGGLAAWNQPIE